MHSLPINYAGLALIILSVILFVLEIKVVSHGILTVGGVISLLLGSIMLIKEESMLEVISISAEIIATIVILTVLFFSFAITLGIKAQRSKPTTGAEGIVGETGEAITPIDPEGRVQIHGEIWRAESAEGRIEINEKITVKAVENLKLIVGKK